MTQIFQFSKIDQKMIANNSSEYNFIQLPMINKIVGYGGFKSYSEQPYATKKQGKQLQENNQVWTATKREADKINALNNYNHYNTIYKNQHLQNTQPKDYHPEHVQKGASSSLNFQAQSSTKPYDQLQAEKSGLEAYRKDFNPLKTGVQHWKTNYQAEILQPNNFSKTTNSLNQGSKVGMRSQSTGKPAYPSLIDQELSKAMSYKNRPYMNNAKTGTTDYRFNYGQRIGSTPFELLSKDSAAQPIRNHPLKHGTNQLWTQIPGYQGFKPSQLHFEQLKSKLQQRSNIDRGDKKLNLMQNYHVHIPGYAGFKPKYSDNNNQLRDSCFQYKPK